MGRTCLSFVGKELKTWRRCKTWARRWFHSSSKTFLLLSWWPWDHWKTWDEDTVLKFCLLLGQKECKTTPRYSTLGSAFGVKDTHRSVRKILNARHTLNILRRWKKVVKRSLSYCLLSRKRSTNPTKVTEKSGETNNKTSCYVSSYTLQKNHLHHHLFYLIIYLNKTKLYQILRLVLKKVKWVMHFLTPVINSCRLH